MKLFNKNKVVDERVENIKNKIYKQTYILTLTLCVLSVAVKFIVYDIDIEIVLTEYIIIFATSVFYIIRAANLGIYADEAEVHDRTNKLSMKTKMVIFAVVFGLAISVFFGIRSAVIYAEEGEKLYFFLLSFFGSVMVYTPVSIALILIADAAARSKSKKNDESEDE